MKNFEYNTIKYVDRFQCYSMILKNVSKDIIPFLVSPNYKYLLFVNYEYVPNHTWHILKETEFEGLNVQGRNITFDLLVESNVFLNKPSAFLMPTGVRVIQMDNKPPWYLNFSRLNEKTQYEMLNKDCEWLFDFYASGQNMDCAISSSSKEFLESILTNPKLNLEDLP